MKMYFPHFQDKLRYYSNPKKYLKHRLTVDEIQQKENNMKEALSNLGRKRER